MDTMVVFGTKQWKTQRTLVDPKGEWEREWIPEMYTQSLGQITLIFMQRSEKMEK